MKHSIVRVAASVLALACFVPAAHAGIYKCKTVGGRTVISDKPCTQESLGKEGLKLATPEPEAAKPPETSPHEIHVGSSGTPGKPNAERVDAEAAGAPHGDPDEPAISKKSRKRTEEAEKQSENQ